MAISDVGAMAGGGGGRTLTASFPLILKKK